MKKDVNGVIFEMTEEEIAEMQKEHVELPPSAEERLEVLEGAFMELVGVLYNG